MLDSGEKSRGLIFFVFQGRCFCDVPDNYFEDERNEEEKRYSSRNAILLAAVTLINGPPSPAKPDLVIPFLAAPLQPAASRTGGCSGLIRMFPLSSSEIEKSESTLASSKLARAS